MPGRWAVGRVGAGRVMGRGGTLLACGSGGGGATGSAALIGGSMFGMQADNSNPAPITPPMDVTIRPTP